MELETNKLGLVPLKAAQAFDKYNKGEIAGFAPKRAEVLLKRGLAVLASDKQASEMIDKQQRKYHDKNL